MKKSATNHGCENKLFKANSLNKKVHVKLHIEVTSDAYQSSRTRVLTFGLGFPILSFFVYKSKQVSDDTAQKRKKTCFDIRGLYKGRAPLRDIMDIILQL